MNRDQYSKEYLPDFKALSEKFSEDNEEILFGKINCGGSNQDFCQSLGVTQFPTVRYGSPYSLEDFRRARTFESNVDFFEENVKPICWPSKPHLCSEDELKKFEEVMALEIEALQERIQEEEQKMVDAEQYLLQQKENLREEFNGYRKSRDDTFEFTEFWLAKAVKHLKESEDGVDEHDEL